MKTLLALLLAAFCFGSAQAANPQSTEYLPIEERLLQASFGIYDFSGVGDESWAESIWRLAVDMNVVDDRPDVKPCVIQAVSQRAYLEYRRELIRDYLAKTSPAKLIKDLELLPSLARMHQAKITRQDQTNISHFFIHPRYEGLRRAVFYESPMNQSKQWNQQEIDGPTIALTRKALEIAGECSTQFQSYLH